MVNPIPVHSFNEIDRLKSTFNNKPMGLCT